MVYEALDPSHPMFDDKEGTVEVDLWGVTVDVHRPLLAAGLASLTANLDALFAGMEAAPPEEGAEATRGSGGGDDDGVAGMPGSPGSPQAGAEGAEGAGQGEGFGSRAEELPAWMVRRSAVRTDVRVHEGSLCVRHEGPGARPLAVMTVQGWTVSADLRRGWQCCMLHGMHGCVPGWHAHIRCRDCRPSSSSPRQAALTSLCTLSFIPTDTRRWTRP